jgi:hypothetical protein
MEQLDRRNQAPAAIPGAASGVAGEILQILDATLAASVQPAGRAAAEARRLADHATAMALSFPPAVPGERAPPDQAP